METRKTNIDLLRPGDLILHDGVVKTLTGTNVREDKFMGRSIWGDTYRLGYKPVVLVTKLP